MAPADPLDHLGRVRLARGTGLSFPVKLARDLGIEQPASPNARPTTTGPGGGRRRQAPILQRRMQTAHSGCGRYRRRQPGAIGALLRREGLYASHLVTWRRERQTGILKGLTPHKPGPKFQTQSAGTRVTEAPPAEPSPMWPRQWASLPPAISWRWPSLPSIGSVLSWILPRSALLLHAGRLRRSVLAGPENP